MDRIMVEDQIARFYSGPVLKEIFTRYLKPFVFKHPQAFLEKNLDLRSLDHITVPKIQLVRVLSTIADDLWLLERWMETLPQPLQNALLRVAWKGPILAETLSSDIGCRVLETGRSDRKTLQAMFNPLKLDHFRSFWGAAGNAEFLDLPPIMKRQLQDLYPDRTGVTPVSPGQIEPSFQDENGILEILPLMIRFLKQGELETTRQGAPRAASLRRLQAVGGIQEFFRGERHSAIRYLRTEMVLDLLLICQLPAEPLNPAMALKALFQQYIQLQQYPHKRFFSHVRGMTHCRGSFRRTLHCVFWELLTGLSESEWYSIDQLLEKAALSALDLAPVDLACADRYLYVTTEWRGWGNRKRYVTPSLYDSVLVTPVLKATLFFFASFGLLDLAYDSTETSKIGGEGCLTIYDGLRAIRLTALGALITEQRSLAELATPETVVACELDVNRPFIQCSGPKQLAEVMLQPFARRVAPHRYRFDEVRFLKGCETRMDLETKIQRFNRIIGKGLPPYWETVFSDMLSKTGILKPAGEFTVFQIMVEDERAVEQLIGDRVLRSLIRLAEGRFVLVHRDDIAQLKQRLTELGYLM